MTDKREQVALQCEAIVHMGKALGELYSGYAEIFRDGGADILIDQVGKRTASFMEKLGDMLNATDACTKEDEWMNPVFKEAHRLWPQQGALPK